MQQSRKLALILADQNSIVHDYCARQKVGGIHLKFFTKKQLPIIPPNQYSNEGIEYIVKRVLKITYTSHAMNGWGKELGCIKGPYKYNANEILMLRSELDALYARLYGITREELMFILDPSSVMGDDYPSQTFPGLKNKEINEFGEYRTMRLILEAWDRQEQEPELWS